MSDGGGSGQLMFSNDSGDGELVQFEMAQRPHVLVSSGGSDHLTSDTINRGKAMLG